LVNRLKHNHGYQTVDPLKLQLDSVEPRSRPLHEHRLSKIPSENYDRIVAALKRLGFSVIRQRGSHIGGGAAQAAAVFDDVRHVPRRYFHPWVFLRALNARVTQIYLNWREHLRYRTNRPYAGEVARTFQAVSWLLGPYRYL
jgi:hypothetical protein